MKGQASQPRTKTQSEFRSQASSQNGMTNRSRSVSAHRKQVNVFNQMYGKNKTPDRHPNKKPKILYQSSDTLQVQSNLTQRRHKQSITDRRASDLKGDNNQHTRNPSKGSGYLVTNTKSMMSNNSVMSKQKNLLNDFYGVRSKSRPRNDKDNDSLPNNPGQRFSFAQALNKQIGNSTQRANIRTIRDRSMSTEDVVITPRLKNQQIKTSPFPANKNPFKSAKDSHQIISLSNINDLRNLKMRLNVESPGLKNNRNLQKVEQIPSAQKTVMYQEHYMLQTEKPQINVVLNRKKMLYQSPSKAIKVQDTGVSLKKTHTDFDPHNDDDQDQIKSETYFSDPSSPKTQESARNLAAVPEMSFQVQQNLQLDELNESQNFHKLKIDQDKIRKINEGLEKNVSESKKIQENLQSKKDHILQTEPYELQNESLIRMGDALQQLNADLQAKLQTKIQENFRAELKSIRSLSAKSRTNRSKSFKRRKSLDQATIDDDTSANITVTASAYGTMVSKSNFLQEGRSTIISNMDLSEQDMVEQSKLADKKIELLQKQILLIEQRQKLEKLQIEKESELTLAIVPLEDIQNQKEDVLDFHYKKSSKNNTQKQNITKDINESFAKAQSRANHHGIPQNRDQDEDPYDQSQALKIVDNRKFMNQNSNMESESLKQLAKQYDQDRLDKNLQDLIPNLQSGPFNDKNLCIGTSKLDNFGHRKLRESIAEAKKSYVDNSPQQTLSENMVDNIHALSSIPAIDDDIENVGEATLNLNSDMSHLEIQNSVMKTYPSLRMSTNISNMHYKNMNQDVDLQYVYHVKQLISMLRQQSQMKIYAEQIKVYLENHRNYIKVKQESNKEDRKEVPQPVMGADSIIEGYQMLQKCLLTTTQGQSQSSLGSIRQHLKMASSVKPEQITMQIHLVISLLKAIDAQIKKDINEYRRLQLSVVQSSRRPLSRYLNNGNRRQGANYSYQESYLVSRPLSNYQNSDIAMSQRGASRQKFVSKVSQNQAPSINSSIKAVDRTNSGHNIMINQGVDSPKMERFSSNSPTDEKMTVKKHQQDQEEIKQEQVELFPESMTKFQRKESTVSKKIEQKYIEPVPELLLNVVDLVTKPKTAAQKEEPIQNQSTTSQLTERARSRLAKASDRLGVRMQKELDKSENRSLNSYRSARPKPGLHGKSPRSGNLFGRKNKHRSDAVSSRSGKRSHLSVSATRQIQQVAQPNGSGIFMDDKSISAVSNPSAMDNDLISFSRFQRISNAILKESFKEEPYAQLVSIPAIYKKSTQQLSNNFDPTMNDQDIEKLLKLFIITELKNQIHIYKIQFKQDEKTPQPDFADKIQETQYHRKDSISFSQMKQENLNTPEKNPLQFTTDEYAEIISSKFNSNISKSQKEVGNFGYNGTQLTVGLGDIQNQSKDVIQHQPRETLTTLKTESASESGRVYKNMQPPKKNLFSRDKSTGSERSFKSSHSRRRRANLTNQGASPMSKQNATINSGQPMNGNESETTVKNYYHDLSSDQAYRQNNAQVIDIAKETNQSKSSQIQSSQQRTQEADSPYIKNKAKGRNSPNEDTEIIQPKQENTVEKESDDEGKDTPRFKDKSSSKILMAQEDSAYLSIPRKSLLIDDPRDTLNAIKPIPETNSEYNLSSKYSEISNKNKYSLNFGNEKQQ